MGHFPCLRPVLACTLILAVTTPLHAKGSCLSRFRFNLTSEGPWPAYMTVKSGEHCGSRTWFAGGTTSYSMLYLIAKPQHGTLSLLPHAHYVYRPNAGYVGEDSFMLRVCGRTQSGPGCANVQFHVTVQNPTSS
jgi:hypothetical protein